MVPIVPMTNGNNSARDMADALDMAREHSVEEIRALRAEAKREGKKGTLIVIMAAVILVAASLICTFFEAFFFFTLSMFFMLFATILFAAAFMSWTSNTLVAYDLAESIKLYEETKKEPDKSKINTP